jgi:hypothetical protein
MHHQALHRVSHDLHWQTFIRLSSYMRQDAPVALLCEQHWLHGDLGAGSKLVIYVIHTLSSLAHNYAIDMLSLWRCMTQGVAVRESGITGLITQFAGMKDVVQLHGGLPPPAAFPISGVSLRLADGGSIDISDPDLVGCNMLKLYLTSSDLG